MTGIEASMQSYYAARAPEYDNVYLKPERQADLQRLRDWLPPIFAHARVLEVACGTGYWTQFIAPTAAEVVAIDTSPETLAIAGKRVARSNVRFLVGDAYCLPTNPGGFDAAFAGFWFSHIPKRRQLAFLAGLGRVLDPGATVVLLDNLYVAGSSHPIAERDAEGNTYQSRALGDGSTHRVLKNFPSESELNALVDGLGSRAIFTCFEYYWAFRYASVRP
jgi:ubiquinone/menaquinone biosynthesis C-methylase UbiE